MTQEGRLLIFSAPSGAGKTTLVHHLLKCPDLHLSFSVSATSRPKRSYETDGKDYHFITNEEFENRVQQGDFLEWEEVYPGTKYGSLKQDVDRLLRSGRNVIFDVDVQGGINIKKYYGARALAIFVQPPSVEALEQRLRYRSTESEEMLRTRIDKAEHEMSHAKDFEVVIVNDDLHKAKAEAERLASAFLS